jgi:two-component system, NarL family, nitrate/nitrite response regulator NarL
MPKQLPLKTIVADDHRLFRQGLISLMNARPDLVTVIGEAEHGAEAVEMCERLNPDLVMMDILMPQMDGLQAAKRILKLNPNTAIIMLTASSSNEHLGDALDIGVSGYLQKNLDSNELFDLILGITDDKVAITNTTASQIMKNMGFGRGRQSTAAEQLTSRELEVLRLAATGISNPQIAARLQISVNTVKAHIKSILDKLNLENRTQLAAYATRKGLITQEGNN